MLIKYTLSAAWGARVPHSRPAFSGPRRLQHLDGDWHTVYLRQLVLATMIAICEAAGKQMLFFHLWNQVVGKYSGFQCRKAHLINPRRQCQLSQKYLTTFSSIGDQKHIWNHSSKMIIPFLYTWLIISILIAGSGVPNFLKQKKCITPFSVAERAWSHHL